MPPRSLWDDHDVDLQPMGGLYQSLPAKLLENNMNMTTHVDTATRKVANTLEEVFSRGSSLRTNTLMHKTEWELLNVQVIQMQANVLPVINDFRAFLGMLMSMSDASFNMPVEVDDEEDRLNLLVLKDHSFPPSAYPFSLKPPSPSLHRMMSHTSSFSVMRN